jgi:hypothetical protein
VPPPDDEFIANQIHSITEPPYHSPGTLPLSSLWLARLIAFQLLDEFDVPEERLSSRLARCSEFSLRPQDDLWSWHRHLHQL